MPISDLTYRKYGTRIAGPDETNDGAGLQQFAYDGTQAMLAGTEWEILPGPAERVAVGSYDGEDVFAYLWPIACPSSSRDLSSARPCTRDCDDDECDGPCGLADLIAREPRRTNCRPNVVEGGEAR